VRLELNDDMTAVSAATVIEFANAAMTATTGVIVGDTIHYVGRGPAPEFPPGQFPPALGPELGKTVIMTAPLD
jgi:hypothetical protein